MKIVVASTSAIKCGAVRDVWPWATVVPFAAASGVPEQPHNQSVGRRGANNRLVHAMTAVEGADLYVSIENYVCRREGRVVDEAAILLRTATGKPVNGCPESVPVHAEFTDYYMRQIGSNTARKMMKPWGVHLAEVRPTLRVEPRDPHAAVHTCGRRELLRRELLAMSREIEAPRHLNTTALTFVDDFPKPGVRFLDVNVLLRQPQLWRSIVDMCVQHAQRVHCTGIAMLDARGFLLGSTLAHVLGLPATMVRKAGKLPSNTTSASYSLEYRDEDKIEMDTAAFGPGDRVLLVDDVLATGGTMRAAMSLVAAVGATVGGGRARALSGAAPVCRAHPPGLRRRRGETVFVCRLQSRSPASSPLTRSRGPGASTARAPSVCSPPPSTCWPADRVALCVARLHNTAWTAWPQQERERERGTHTVFVVLLWKAIRSAQRTARCGAAPSGACSMRGRAAASPRRS